MADPFVGEIRMFGGTFAPLGWAFCNGQLLSISDYQTLFAVLGTTYGGDGQTTFGLPNLVGRLPLHQGTSPSTGTPYALGQSAGTETVTLQTQHLPAHGHALNATSAAAGQASPAGQLPANLGAGARIYASVPSGVPMAPQSIGPAGGGQPHANMMPFLAVSFIIALDGLFPTSN